jgi:periplasmic protein TonB
MSVIISHVALGQGTEKKIGYVNENGFTVADSTSPAAKYYRTIELNEKCYCYIVREYTREGRIRSVGEYSQYDEQHHTQEGRSIQYYENGNIKHEGIYRSNKPTGEFIYYYENGKTRERVEGISDFKPRYVQGYDTQGRELLTDGNGELKDTDDDGNVIYSKVRDHHIVSCYKLAPAQDTLFLPIVQMAEYPGGMPAMLRFLSENVKYPRSARKARIEGSVFVSFVVAKNGSLQDIMIVKGISPECDAEVIRVIQRMKAWNLAVERGKAIKSRFVLPVKFHLRH